MTQVTGECRLSLFPDAVRKVTYQPTHTLTLCNKETPPPTPSPTARRCHICVRAYPPPSHHANGHSHRPYPYRLCRLPMGQCATVGII